MNEYEASIKNPLGRPVTGPLRTPDGRLVAKIFVVCNQRDTAPIWGYILRQQGLIVILETSLEKVIDRWTAEVPDLVVLDLSISHEQRMQLYQRFRDVSVAPIILFLPSYHEIEIMEAYQAGVDDVVVKPISPPIFLAKIMAWVRRSWTVPVASLGLIRAGNHRLDSNRHCMIKADGSEIKLTNLEFRLLHLLMSRPGQVFSVEEMIESIWGGYGDGDQVLLKNVVYRLRKKIETDPGRPSLLQTWQGGYCFAG